MLKIIDVNDSGKTRKLLSAIAGDPDAVIVCKRPDRIAEKCSAYGISKVEALSYEDLLAIIKDDNVEPSERRKIYIDEIEEFIKVCCPNLQGYTLTNE